MFEEQGVVKQPFYGGFGLLAEDGLPKPAFNAFQLLHRLGDRRIATDSNSILVTRRSDGMLVLAVWNLFLPEQHGEAKDVTILVKGLRGKHHALISRLDKSHGSLLEAYNAMGKPAYPTRVQIEKLRQAAQLGPAAREDIIDGKIKLTLPPQGLALIELN